MKLPNPNDPPTTDESGLYTSLIGDVHALLEDEAHWKTIYNYDNPRENIILVTHDNNSFSILSIETPCCHRPAKMENLATFDALGNPWVVKVLLCTGCRLFTYNTGNGMCRENPTMLGLTQYSYFERSGRLYIKHHDKNLGLSPGSAKASFSP